MKIIYSSFIFCLIFFTSCKEQVLSTREYATNPLALLTEDMVSKHANASNIKASQQTEKSDTFSRTYEYVWKSTHVMNIMGKSVTAPAEAKVQLLFFTRPEEVNQKQDTTDILSRYGEERINRLGGKAYWRGQKDEDFGSLDVSHGSLRFSLILGYIPNCKQAAINMAEDMIGKWRKSRQKNIPNKRKQQK